mgnify:CR=1 FL=1
MRSSSPMTNWPLRSDGAGNPRATKIDVAEYLARHGFDQVSTLIPKRPALAALGLRPKDKYWLHVFDAHAIAQGAQHLSTPPRATSK